jgi:hypothetical protein
MWPLDHIRKRRYDRRYKAALIVLLGKYMFDSLSPEQRQRIESEVDSNFNRSTFPAAAYRRTFGSSPFLSASRAAAMQVLGIPPPTGMTWQQLFEPWSFWRVRHIWPDLRGCDMAPGYVDNDYRAMDRATADARAFLRQRGLDVPEADRWDSA